MNNRTRWNREWTLANRTSSNCRIFFHRIRWVFIFELRLISCTSAHSENPRTNNGTLTTTCCLSIKSSQIQKLVGKTARKRVAVKSISKKSSKNVKVSVTFRGRVREWNANQSRLNGNRQSNKVHATRIPANRYNRVLFVVTYVSRYPANIPVTSRVAFKTAGILRAEVTNVIRERLEKMGGTIRRGVRDGLARSFPWKEDWILVADELTLSKHCYQTRSGESIKGLTRSGCQIASRLLRSATFDPFILGWNDTVFLPFPASHVYAVRPRISWSGRKMGEKETRHRWNITGLLSVCPTSAKREHPLSNSS